MDKKDLKILAELEMDSRIPINLLAKKVGVSKEVANYRVKRLVSNKTILEFYPVINTTNLGFSRFGCFIQLKNINNDKENKFLKYLIDHEFTVYLGPIIGKWNFVFDILAKDRDHLIKIIKEISSEIQEYLESLIIMNISSEQENFPTKILGLKKRIEFNTEYKNIKLDKTDLKILELMSNNSRIEYKDLSKKLNLSANAIKYRIKSLEKYGIIKGYSITIDVKKLGYELHNIQIKLTNQDKINSLKEFLRNNLNVIYFYNYLGNENWDMDIGVVVKNSLDLRDFINKLRERFGDIIKIHDIYTIVELSKGNITPKGIFK